MDDGRKNVKDEGEMLALCDPFFQLRDSGFLLKS
jgi:hypothetical protein